jgi:hypothetical protein
MTFVDTATVFPGSSVTRAQSGHASVTSVASEQTGVIASITIGSVE